MNKRLLTSGELEKAIESAVGYPVSVKKLPEDDKAIMEAQDAKTLKEVVELIDKTGLILHTDSPLHEIGATILDCPACCWYAYKKEWGIE